MTIRHRDVNDWVRILVLVTLGIVLLYLGFVAGRLYFSQEKMLWPGKSSPTLGSAPANSAS